MYIGGVILFEVGDRVCFDLQEMYMEYLGVRVVMQFFFLFGLLKKISMCIWCWDRVQLVKLCVKY